MKMALPTPEGWVYYDEEGMRTESSSNVTKMILTSCGKLITYGREESIEMLRHMKSRDNSLKFEVIYVW